MLLFFLVFSFPCSSLEQGQNFQISLPLLARRDTDRQPRERGSRQDSGQLQERVAGWAAHLFRVLRSQGHRWDEKLR